VYFMGDFEKDEAERKRRRRWEKKDE